MTEPSPVEQQLARAATELLAPLRAAAESATSLEACLLALGWRVNAIEGLADAMAPLARTITAVQALSIHASEASSDPQHILTDLAKVGVEVALLVDTLSRLRFTAATPDEAARLAAELALDLTSWLTSTWLRWRWPLPRLLLIALGVLERRELPVLTLAGTEVRAARIREQIDFDQVGRWFTDPPAALRVIGERFAQPGAAGAQMAEQAWQGFGPMLPDALWAARLSSLWLPADPIRSVPASLWVFTSPEHLGEIGTSAPPNSPSTAGDNAKAWVVIGMEAVGADFEVHLVPGGRWHLDRQTERWQGSVQAAATAAITFAGSLVRTTGNATASASLATRSSPALRFGFEGGPGLVIGGVILRIECAMQDTQPWSLELAADLTGVAVQLGAGGGDGFLADVLDSLSIPPFDLGLRWSPQSGLRFTTSPRLSRFILIRSLLLGPLEVRDLAVSAGSRSDGLTLTLDSSLQLSLGPLVCTIMRLGLHLGLDSKPGAAGLANLRVGVKPPSGVAIRVDSGPVKGGGFLFFDPDEATYAGAVQLSVKALSFNAVGVVTARLPDGSDGFSMLVIITAEFPPIQLGFGFSLIGIGGLAGIHRTMDQDALAQCLREGRLGSILFPRDVVANVRTIVDDIRTVFPPQRDRHVFGPMVKIGWGANALLEMDVAILLSLPSPIVIAILGRMRAALPTKDDPVVDLRLEVLGLIDFGRAKLTIEARLVDSRIAAFAVSGGMAMLLSWGATKAFVLSVGGFNRRFLPPPDFHAPARMAIALSSGENPTFTLSSYFAVTSNAVQFGAAIDAHMQVETVLGVFSLAAYAQFDVLLIFDPPFFAADLIAGIEVKRNGATLFLARLEASLTGPEPWRISGIVEVQIVVPLRIPFDHTLGEPAAETPSAGSSLVELRQKLAAEIARAENWAALPAGEGEAVVSMRRVEAMPGTVLVHPLGGVGFRQRLLPLEKTLRKFGTAMVSDPGGFAIEGLTLGGSAIAARALFDDFAPGEFERLNDDEKLTRPAFETLAAGVEATSAGVGLPQTVRQSVNANFEETVINPDYTTRNTQSAQPGLGYVQADTRLLGDAGAAAISVRPERYVLAERDTLQTHVGGEAAYALLEDERRRGDAGSRVTVPVHEAILVIEA